MQARAFHTGAAHINALHKSEPEVQTDGAAAACRKEGERYAHNGEKCQAHTDIRNGLQCDKSEESEADTSAEVISGFICNVQDAHKIKEQKQNQGCAADKAEFFAGYGENKVTVLECNEI